MAADAPRPDPDLLLRRVQAEEARATRAKLKIFLGYAPGVGKTFKMLQLAADLVIAKVDVVVGVVETHGRYDTGALLLGLEVLPRRKLAHRGKTFEELDLEGALARRPRVILVDELAHTNVPGARHTKRWQDVLDLLDAGIDVQTTLNVQHVESLNDVVAQITGVQVRETVPDSILDRADEIELVDVPPDELIARLGAGKVYLPEAARRAADHFFQRGNLLALRDLALRRATEHVDQDVQEYRAHHAVARPWAAAERILVCVGPNPAAARLVRAGRRMAAGLRAPWGVVHVDRIGRPLGADDARALDGHLRLAESLGGEVVRLVGARPGETILDWARRHDVTRLVVGKPTHARLRDLVRGALLDELVRGSGAIDVHVISGDDPPARAEVAPVDAGPRPGRRAYASSAGIVAVTTAIAIAMEWGLHLPDPEMSFMLAIMIAAAWLGRGPALLAAALSVAAYDFFFVPPRYTFSIADSRYLLTFGVMFGVGASISTLAAQLRQQQRETAARADRTAALYALSRDLGAAVEASAIAEVAARHAAQAVRAQVVVLLPDADGVLARRAAVPASARLESTDEGVARWVHEHGRAAGWSTDTVPGARWLCLPLRPGATTIGVLALAPDARARFGAEQRGFLESLARQVAFAAERARLAEEARAHALRARTEELRSALLSAVSHDLRTPLATITGAASTVLDGDGLPAATKTELVASIAREAERLERLVSNLLEMTRLQAGQATVTREWIPLEEVVGACVTRLEARLAAHPVTTALPADLPLIPVDAVLLEQVFVNLLDNATKYTPPGTPIEIAARALPQAVEVTVADRGPGFAAGEERRVFERFYRGDAAGAARGAGLGLAICRGIVEAHGGTITAEAREGGGARFRLVLPLVGTPPTPPPLEGDAIDG